MFVVPRFCFHIDRKGRFLCHRWKRFRFSPRATGWNCRCLSAFRTARCARWCSFPTACAKTRSATRRLWSFWRRTALPAPSTTIAATARRRCSAGNWDILATDGANALVDDLHQVTEWLRGRFPGKRVYLFGHSMGSLAARVYAGRFDSELAGLWSAEAPAGIPARPLGGCWRAFLGRAAATERAEQVFEGAHLWAVLPRVQKGAEQVRLDLLGQGGGGRLRGRPPVRLYLYLQRL